MIYFMSIAEPCSPIKIGYTANRKNLRERLSSLQVGNFKEIVCLGTMPGNLRDELMLHVKFDDLRIRGEWFNSSRSLRKYIKDNARQDVQFDLPEEIDPTEYAFDYEAKDVFKDPIVSPQGFFIDDEVSIGGDDVED